jgi:uridine kinase
MKVAILMSGYLRTIKTNLPNFKEKILNKFDNVDVYVHITKNEENEDRYLNEYSDIDFIQKEIKPISIIHEPNFFYSENIRENNLINTWAKYYKLNNIKKINEIVSGEYDLVIKYRPDLELISDIDLFKNNITIPIDSKIDNSKLLNQNDKYVCDIMAYGPSKEMDKYFSLYEDIKSLISNYGDISETILYYHLNNKNIKYNLLDIEYFVILSECNIFAIAGDSGSGKSTLAKILKEFFSSSILLECDRYHKWERNDDNWKKLTHLNPESNYLTKMSQDIFDLKVGKDVYQVDYDHKTGKFTDKQLINSDSDNIIVCGLHSLYTENNNIYNLKIFIDTDEKLKTKWKINRDVKERGYLLEKVLEQIENRRNDYNEYILPQRDKSDLIINFYEENETISLKLFIKNVYNNNVIYNTFQTKGADFKYYIYDNTYDVYDFKSYVEIDFWGGKKIPLLKNFYDYILYLILTLNESFK